MKSYVYQCVRCGGAFLGPSPALHLLVVGRLVEHCGAQAQITHVEEAVAVEGSRERASGAEVAPSK